jgi:hypothetical protein
VSLSGFDCYQTGKKTEKGKGQHLNLRTHRSPLGSK